MNTKITLMLVMGGMLGGMVLSEWYDRGVAPVVYAQEVEVVEPKVVLIRPDYTGWTTQRLQEEIRKSLPEIFIDIARCESGIRQYNQRGDVLVGIVDSRDTGVFQVNTYYHLEASKSLGMDIYTPVGNIAYATYLYHTEGLAPWSASRKCWQG